MAKGEAANTNRMIDSSRNQYQDLSKGLSNQLLQQQQGAYNTDKVLKTGITEGYNNIVDSGGLTQDSINRIRAIGGIGGNTYGGTPASVEKQVATPGSMAPLQMQAAANGPLSPKVSGMGTLTPKASGITPYNPQASMAPIAPKNTGFQVATGPSSTYNQMQGAANQNIQDSVTGLRGLGNGPIDPVYNEFANTGGYDPRARQDFRARATSTIPSLYSNLRATAANANRASGGYGPGFTANLAKMGRDQAAGFADASRNAEVDLNSQINAGRQWGTTGRVNQGLDLERIKAGALGTAGQLGVSQGQMAGDRGNLDLGFGRLGLDANNATQDINAKYDLANQQNDQFGRNLGLQAAQLNQTNDQFGRSLQSDYDSKNLQNDQFGRSLGLNYDTLNQNNDQFGRSLNLDTGKANQQNEQFGRNLDLGYADLNSRNALETGRQGIDVARNNATNSYNNNALAMNGEQFIAQTPNDNRLKALGGLTNLYGTAPGETNSYMDQMQKQYGLGAEQNQGALDLRAKNNPNVSTLDQISKIAGMGASVGQSLLGGLGTGGASNIGNGSGFQRNLVDGGYNWNPNITEGQGSGFWG